jgi:hypothetical protein
MVFFRRLSLFCLVTAGSCFFSGADSKADVLNAGHIEQAGVPTAAEVIAANPLGQSTKWIPIVFLVPPCELQFIPFPTTNEYLLSEASFVPLRKFHVHTGLSPPLSSSAT